jgi:hypothetical protein
MGDNIEFFARIKMYKKGESEKTDYKLSHPTKVKKIKKHQNEVIRRTRSTIELNKIIAEVVKEGSWKR